MRGTLAGVALSFALALAGCGKDEDHGHGGGGDGGPPPTGFAEGIERMEHHSAEIDELIAAGKLDDVHREAAEITKIAELLPGLAKSMAPEMLKEINLKSKELAAMFTEIDEAADAGRKEETQKLHETMKALIADLKKHAH